MRSSRKKWVEEISREEMQARDKIRQAHYSRLKKTKEQKAAPIDLTGLQKRLKRHYAKIENKRKLMKG